MSAPARQFRARGSRAAALCALAGAAALALGCGRQGGTPKSAESKSQAAPALPAGPAACGSAAAAGAAAASDAVAARARLRADPRIGALIYPCPNASFYDRDTADMVPVLVEKLSIGQTDPLHHAKEELAVAGEAALQEVGRLLERSFSDPLAFGPLQNALDVASMASGDRAHDLLVRGLDHPRDAVRAIALSGLVQGHARPGDYDRLLLQLEIERDLKSKVIHALHTAEAERAEQLYLDWIEHGERASIWPELLAYLQTTQVAATQARARTLWREAPELLKFDLAIAAARGGDAEALEFLREQARDNVHPELRSRGLVALVALVQTADLVEAALRETQPALQRLCVQGLAAGSASPKALEVLRVLLASGTPEVAEAVAALLIQWDAPEGRDWVLAQLEGDSSSLEHGVHTAWPLMEAHPELAKAVFARLLARAEAERELPLEQRMGSLQALALVPLAEAAQYLRALALAQPEGARLRGLRAHEWLMIQAANTGAAGRAFLAEELAHEQDPLRRLDLLWAVAAEHCAADGGPCAAREALIAALERDPIAPLEALFIADRLVRVGPAARIAPRLKRACLRVEDPEVRTAMQCLLWRWY